MKRSSVSVPTFDLFERVADGPRRRYTPPPDACADCGGADREHARWCPQNRVHRDGEAYVGRGRALAATELSHAQSTRTSRAPSGRRSPRRDGRVVRRAC